MTPLAKAQLVKTLGREVGFDLLGVARPAPLERAAYYRDWLAAGYGGSMTYLSRNVQLRTDPSRLLPGARSILCGAVNYKRSDGYLGLAAIRHGPTEQAVHGHPTGQVAQYARGRDYHVVLRRMFDTLLTRLRERLPEPFDARVYVDAGPVLERELAAAAGLGWFGKNTCLLNAHLGSYFFLGEVITTLDLAPDEPVAERCARCARCLEACPTGAFIGPRMLDATRCIAYLTIEHRGPIPERFHAAMGDCVFGCDVCQQVCPYNAQAALSSHPDLAAVVLPQRLDLLVLSQLWPAEYRRLMRGSAAVRASRAMWRRNARIALRNARRLGSTGGGFEDGHREPAP